MTTYADSIKNVQDYVRLPLLYNHWCVAGLGEEFDRTPKERTLLERSLVFYRTTEGQLVAAQNRCLHRSFPLAESKLEGDELVCGYHGIRYNPEGLMIRVPGQKKCPDRKLRTYKTEQIGDRPVEQWDGGLALSPGVFMGDAPIKIGDPDSDDVQILNRYIMHYLTPETSTTHHYWWSYTDDFTPNTPKVKEMLTPPFDKVFSEDSWACAHMQKLLDNDKSEYTELVIGGDKAGLLFRRIVLGWVEDEYGTEAP